jgi:hypothetical protein
MGQPADTGRTTVSRDDLVCAACSGRVVDARCPACRASRDLLDSQRPALPAGPLLLAAAVLLLLLALLT